MFDDATNKIWTKGFCRAAASIISNYHFYVEVIKIYGSIEKAREDKNGMDRLVKKYMISVDDSNMYVQKLNALGFNGTEITITEEDLAKAIKKVKNLPEKYIKAIMKSPCVTPYKKEVNYYYND